MNPFALIFGFGLLALSVFFVASPFRFKEPPKQSVRSDVKMATVNQRQAVLLALRDLDFDYQAGKVADEDYHTLRAELLNEAAQVIQGQERQNEAIETLIQSRRKTRSNPQPPSKAKSDKLAEKLCKNCQAPLHDGAMFCTKCGAPTKEVVCPKCNQSIHPGDRFCPSCGTTVNLANQSTEAKGI
jgi:RNA polymerase subunit RPABC4/transcription elongation factor Spt4